MMPNIVPFNESPKPEDSVANMLLELFFNYKFWRDHNHMISEDYFEKESKKGDALELDYGFLILDGKLPSVEKIDGVWKTWSK